MQHTKTFYTQVDKVVQRAIHVGLYLRQEQVTAMMDISYAADHYHLDLVALYGASMVDFFHDIAGIQRAIERGTHPATFPHDPHWMPRCILPKGGE